MTQRVVLVSLEISPDLPNLTPLELEQAIEREFVDLGTQSDWWREFVDGWTIEADPSPDEDAQ